MVRESGFSSPCPTNQQKVLEEVLLLHAIVSISIERNQWFSTTLLVIEVLGRFYLESPNPNQVGQEVGPYSLLSYLCSLPVASHRMLRPYMAFHRVV